LQLLLFNLQLGSVVAHLALTAALPVARWIEYQTGVPHIEEIIEQPFALDAEGLLRMPTGPSLGITLNREAIARFSPK
jgi:L-alanine-DL-glutamate epimerase-like enolase superfamily enzyme